MNERNAKDIVAEMSNVNEQAMTPSSMTSSQTTW